MNEVTKIHLGRQAFTISIDAHHELKSYLEAISKQVNDREVLEEIELRMAELLTERVISTNKVILPSDIKFLKSQLGKPNEFREEDDQTLNDDANRYVPKRLFRDTDHAMVAGVASGLGQYFGIHVLFIRFLFVVAVLITFGWGILLYIVLWLLVPEVRTSSDRLQMVGKPINVESLKEIVERADVKGAAHRANATLSAPINNLFRFVLKIIGLVFVFSGLSIIFGLVAAATYLLINYSAWMEENIFPIGFREHLLLYIAMTTVAILALFVIILGIAMFRRKWPIRPWVTGTLVGIVFIGLAVGGALAGDVYPNIRDRYNANIHSTVRSLAPFTALSINGPIGNVNFVSTKSYSVDLSYYDSPNVSQVRTMVQNHTLFIDATHFNDNRTCQAICIPNSYDLNITVYAPNALQLANQYDTTKFPAPPIPPVPGSNLQ